MAGREATKRAGDALLTEIQMLLHSHRGQRGARGARRARGEQPLVLGRRPAAGQRRKAAGSPWPAQIRWHSAWRASRARAARRCPRTLSAWLEQSPEDGRHLVILEPTVEALERDWFAPLAAALRAGRIGMLSLHVPDAGALVRDRARRPAPLLAPPQGAGKLRMKLVERRYTERDRQALVAAGVHPLLARLYAARRIASASELRYEPANLLAPGLLKNLEQGARLLADAIAAKKRLLIVADYDADGATACAVGMRALRAFGARRRLPRARPLQARLRPDAGAGRPRRGEEARHPDHRRQRHRQRRRRGARQRARHRHADHRPSPSGRGTAGRGVHRQPEPARLRFPVEGARRRRRDVLSRCSPCEQS